jgi:hypothetical protein
MIRLVCALAGGALCVAVLFVVACAGAWVLGKIEEWATWIR